MCNVPHTRLRFLQSTFVFWNFISCSWPFDRLKLTSLTKRKKSKLNSLITWFIIMKVTLVKRFSDKIIDWFRKSLINSASFEADVRFALFNLKLVLDYKCCVLLLCHDGKTLELLRVRVSLKHHLKFEAIDSLPLHTCSSCRATLYIPHDAVCLHIGLCTRSPSHIFLWFLLSNRYLSDLVI